VQAIESAAGVLKTNNEGYYAGLQKALDAGVPAEQLDGLLQQVERWVVATAPTMRQLEGMRYKKIFVIGGTRDDSESLDPEQINSETRKLFARLQSYDQMTRLFQFIDRSGDSQSNIRAYTGDTRQYGDPLGRDGGQNSGRTEYLPADIFLLKLDFIERRNLNADPPRIDFTIIPIIEWGGNVGQRVAETSFTQSVVYKTNLFNNFTREKGKWVAVE